MLSLNNIQLTCYSGYISLSVHLSTLCVLGIVCLVAFLMSLIFTLGSGNYWLEIFNGYVGSVPFLIISFFEIVGVVYVYGLKR